MSGRCLRQYTQNTSIKENNIIMLQKMLLNWYYVSIG